MKISIKNPLESLRYLNAIDTKEFSKHPEAILLMHWGQVSDKCDAVLSSLVPPNPNNFHIDALQQFLYKTAELVESYEYIAKVLMPSEEFQRFRTFSNKNRKLSSELINRVKHNHFELRAVDVEPASPHEYRCFGVAVCEPKDGDKLQLCLKYHPTGMTIVIGDLMIASLKELFALDMEFANHFANSVKCGSGHERLEFLERLAAYKYDRLPSQHGKKSLGLTRTSTHYLFDGVLYLMPRMLAVNVRIHFKGDGHTRSFPAPSI